LAEAFQRGLERTEYPPDDVPVSCRIRVYPEQALALAREALERLRSNRLGR
jgi:hypothetical protein